MQGWAATWSNGGTLAWLTLIWRLHVLVELIFLVYPLSDLWARRKSLGLVLLGMAGLAVFLVAYLPLVLAHPFKPPAPDPIGRLGLLTAISVVLATVFGSLWFGPFVYTTMVAGLRVRSHPLRALGWVMAITALAILTGWLAPMSLANSWWLVVLAALNGLCGFAFARLVTMLRELGEAREQLAELAVAEERLRFARDLHDLLSQSLSVIALNSELAGRLLDQNPAGAAQVIRKIETVARRSLTEVRGMVHGYRRLHLATELEQASAALAAAGITADTPHRHALSALPPQVESVLAWAVREGITNVVRHSNARRCYIRMLGGEGFAGIEVVDDGHGTVQPASGNGLVGLAERLHAVGGQLQAGNQPGGGFRLAVTLPLDAVPSESPGWAATVTVQP
jgi:two-component system, NarL family, sensor histidine kinase DesK